jgi:hypothetical protein
MKRKFTLALAALSLLMTAAPSPTEAQAVLNPWRDPMVVKQRTIGCFTYEQFLDAQADIPTGSQRVIAFLIRNGNCLVMDVGLTVDIKARMRGPDGKETNAVCASPPRNPDCFWMGIEFLDAATHNPLESK